MLPRQSAHSPTIASSSMVSSSSQAPPAPRVCRTIGPIRPSRQRQGPAWARCRSMRCFAAGPVCSRAGRARMSLSRAASMLGALMLVAAASAPAADLATTVQGKWKADMVATIKESDMFKQLPPDAQKAMLERAALARVSFFEITAKTMVWMMGGKPPEKLTYKVLRAEGQVLAIRFTGKKGGPEETELEVLDADSMRMGKKGGEMAVVLRRVE